MKGDMWPDPFFNIQRFQLGQGDDVVIFFSNSKCYSGGGYYDDINVSSYKDRLEMELGKWGVESGKQAASDPGREGAMTVSPCPCLPVRVPWECSARLHARLWVPEAVLLPRLMGGRPTDGFQLVNALLQQGTGLCLHIDASFCCTSYYYNDTKTATSTHLFTWHILIQSGMSHLTKKRILGNVTLLLLGYIKRAWWLRRVEQTANPKRLKKIYPQLLPSRTQQP